MAKKKGLGRDLDKALEIMDELGKNLADFHKSPLKRGLQAMDIFEDDMAKKVNDALKQAFELSILIADLRHLVNTVKPAKNSRFASRIVERFLKEFV